MWRSINLCKLLEVSFFLIPRPVIRAKRASAIRLREPLRPLLAIRPLVARAKRRCGSRLRVSLQPLLAIRNKKPFDCSKGLNLYQTNNWRRS